MRRFLKAEFNTIYRKPKVYVLLGILVVAFGLGLIIEKKYNVKGLSVGFIQIFYPFLAIVLASDITHKEYKFNTMKNLIGSGFTRSQIYVGKLIVTIAVSFMFMLVKKIIEIVYYVANGNLSTKINWKIELIDGVRQLCMFGIIFIICMLITSDALSLLTSFVYAVLLPFILSVAGAFLEAFIGKNTMNRISSALLVSHDAYIENLENGDMVLHPSQLIWALIGIAVALLALQGGYMLFKRKEFK